MPNSFAVAFSLINPSLLPAAVSYATCKVNGQIVPCGELGGLFNFFFAFLAGFWLIFLTLGILMLVSNWKIYVKAARPGWASLVPIYNVVVLLRIIGKPEWWVILMFIPFVNIIIGIIVIYRIALVFGKGIGFALGLFFLPFIFYPILAFGKSQDTGQNASSGGTFSAPATLT